MAALEVTSVIKNLQERGDKDKIVNVINLLAHEFSRSRNVHHRKGGLIGLAASAIGLGADIDPYLNNLIPPVLECFDDPESRVCYYACKLPAFPSCHAATDLALTKVALSHTMTELLS